MWGLVKADVLRAWSVGWWPLKWESLDGKEKGEGQVFSRAGLRFTEQELWEVSQVTIPAGSNALTLGVSKAAGELAKRFGLTVPDSELPDDLGLLSCGVRLLAKSEDLRSAIEHGSDRIVVETIDANVAPIDNRTQLSIYSDDDVVLASSLEALIENVRSAAEAIRAVSK